MLINADPIEVVLPKFLEFVSDDHIIGHNVNFDINFIYDFAERKLKRPFTNNFTDTLRLSRRINKDLEHHRLGDLATLYHVDYTGAHRALIDCEVTFKVFKCMQKSIISQYSSIEKFQESLKRPYKKYSKEKRLDISKIVATKESFDETHPLFGKTVCFTGTLDKMVRRDAMQLVVDYGGIVKDSVTKNTNYLVLGNNDYCSSIKDGKSEKQKKAEKYILEGQDLQILPEDVFYDMIEESLTE